MIGLMAGGGMSSLVAKDHIINDRRPALILVVDPNGGAGLVVDAVSPIRQHLQVRTCKSLAEASDHVNANSYDAIVLELDLPDAWPADSYRRMSEVAVGVPIIVLTAGQDLRFIGRASPPPFAVLPKDEVRPETLRRLLISAALLKRALS
jgi:hypothetical protein